MISKLTICGIRKIYAKLKPSTNTLLTNISPSFLIIGAQKAGTTTLFNLLDKTHLFKGSTTKEIHFFNSDINYNKGLKWYSDFFRCADNKIPFEATPNYIYSADTPKRIYECFKTMKFIVLLRDPVTRCFSHWNMFRNFNKDKAIAKNIDTAFIQYVNVEYREHLRHLLYTENFPSFNECIEKDILTYKSNSPIEEPSFVRRGLYHEQLLRYLKYFDIKDFLFISNSELAMDPNKTVSNIIDFLQLTNNDKLSHNSSIAINSNKGDYTNTNVDKPTLIKLYEFYEEPNKKLFELIGKKYAWSADWLQ